MKLLNFDRVVCLSPHPDDIEASMGGTILKYHKTKFTSIVFSTGSVHDLTSNEARWEECRQYWKGIKQIEQFFPSPLLKMYDEEEWINLLERSYGIGGFDAIFMPSNQDTHYEHRFVNGIGMALTRNLPISIVEYKSISTMDSWVPNMFVDIIDDFEKVDRLKRFKSQQKLYFQEEYMRAFHSHPTSIRKHRHLTEPFRIITLYD